MTITSVQSCRERVLAVRCPICFAAIGALCTTHSFESGAGIQTKFTNIFHSERISIAQTIVERQLSAIQKEILRNPLH
jgi:hypothetical protein